MQSNFSRPCYRKYEQPPDPKYYASFLCSIKQIFKENGKNILTSQYNQGLEQSLSPKLGSAKHVNDCSLSLQFDSCFESGNLFSAFRVRRPRQATTRLSCPPLFPPLYPASLPALVAELACRAARRGCVVSDLASLSRPR